MSDMVATPGQQEILDALADRWELLQWRCRDGARRWHLGEMEVDGRSVNGLLRRGLLVPGAGVGPCAQLVMADDRGGEGEGSA